VEENCHFVPGLGVPGPRAGFCRRVPRATRFMPLVAGSSGDKRSLPKSGIGESIPPNGLSQRRPVREFSPQGAAQTANSAPASRQAIVWEVLMYCFRFGNCGTFMPLSDVWGESRIAVVWTWFVSVLSAISSGHLSILFTHSGYLSAVDCG
jgi:hypothetical protein